MFQDECFEGSGLPIRMYTTNYFAEEKKLIHPKLKEICVPLSSLATSQITDRKLVQIQNYLTRLQVCLESIVDLDYALSEYSFFPLSILLKHLPALPNSIVQTVLRITTKLVKDGWQSHLDQLLFGQLLILSNSIINRTLSHLSLSEHDDLIREALKCSLSLVESQQAQTLSLVNEHSTLYAFALAELISVLNAQVSDSTILQSLQCLKVYLNVLSKTDLLVRSAPGILSALHSFYRPQRGKTRAKLILLNVIRASTSLLLTCYGPVLSQDTANSPTTADFLPPQNLHLGSNLDPELRIVVLKMLDFARNQDPEIIHTAQDFCLRVLNQPGSILLTVERPLLLFLLDTAMLNLPHQSQDAQDHVAQLRQTLQAFHCSVETILNDEYELVSSSGSDIQIHTLQSLLTRVCTAYNVFAITPHRKRIFILVEKALMIPGGPAVCDRTRPLKSLLLSDQSVTSPVKTQNHSERALPDSFELLLTETLAEKLDSSDFSHLCSKLLNNMQFCTDNQFLWSTNYLAQLVKGRQRDLYVQRAAPLGYGNIKGGKDLPVLILNLLQTPKIVHSGLRSSCLLHIIYIFLENGMPLPLDEGVGIIYPLLTMSHNSDLICRELADKCLIRLTQSWEYPSLGVMILENSDYLINSISIELNTFVISKEMCLVLSNIILIAGAPILSYLDDIKDSLLLLLAENHTKHDFSVPILQVFSSILLKSKAALLSETRRSREGTPDSLEEDIDHSQSSGLRVVSNITPMDPSAKNLTNLVASVLCEMQYIASSDEPETRYHAVKIMGDAFDCLAHEEDTLLPLVHSNWPTLLSRLQDKQIQVRTVSAKSFARLVKACGYFMRTRIDDDWDKLEQVFEQANSVSREATNYKSSSPLIMEHTTAFADLALRIMADVPLSAEIKAKCHHFSALLGN